MAKPVEPFFVGWGKVPKGLHLFLLSTGFSVIAFFAFLSWAISSTQNDPGDAAFMGPAQAIGILQAEPYPVLHVLESERYERGKTILLTGGGKRGVMERASNLDGQVVRVAGARLARGDLKSMQLRNGNNGLRLNELDRSGFEIVKTELGTWKLTGEICDGKCLAGAMRPGIGLAHKACANLCLSGFVPPIFVSSGPVEGSEFLLLANAEGGPVTKEILTHTAVFVEITGKIERHGSLLIFKIDPETIKLAR